MKSKADLHGREPPGHELMNGHSSNDLEELEEDDDSDSSSPPLPYLQAPAPDGCCTLDGKPHTPPKKMTVKIQHTYTEGQILLKMKYEYSTVAVK